MFSCGIIKKTTQSYTVYLILNLYSFVMKQKHSFPLWLGFGCRTFSLQFYLFNWTDHRPISFLLMELQVESFNFYDPVLKRFENFPPLSLLHWKKNNSLKMRWNQLRLCLVQSNIFADVHLKLLYLSGDLLNTFFSSNKRRVSVDVLPHITPSGAITCFNLRIR